MDTRWLLSRQSWIVLIVLDVCAFAAIGAGIPMLFGPEWYAGIPIIVTGAGLLWFNTPSSRRLKNRPNDAPEKRP